MKVIEKAKSALDESKKREAYDLYKKGIQLLLKGLKGILHVLIFTRFILELQSNLYIKTTQGDMKMWPL